MLTLTDYILGNPTASDEQVQAALPPRTAGPIRLADLKPWLDDTGLSRRLARTITSPVFAAVVAGVPGLVLVTMQDDAGSALDYFGSPHNTQLTTDEPERYAKTLGLLGLMQACNVQDATLGLSPDEAAAFLAFGGGVVATPTTEQIAAARTALAKAAADRKHLDAKLAADSAGEVAREQGGDYLAAYSSEYTTRMSEGA